MQNIFLINLTIAGVVFGTVMAYLLRSDENPAKKLAYIRVRIHDRDRRRMPEPRQEEYEQPAPTELLLFAALLLIILLMAPSG